MKKEIIFFLTIGFMLWSFKQPNIHQNYKSTTLIGSYQKMPDIMLKKGCNLCHKANETVVGPDFKSISLAYKGDKAKLIKFLNGEAAPIVNPDEFQYMKPVINQLKHVSADDKEKIAQYILSFK